MKSVSVFVDVNTVFDVVAAFVFVTIDGEKPSTTTADVAKTNANIEFKNFIIERILKSLTFS